MLRTNGYFSIIVLFFLIFVDPSWAQADFFSQDQNEKTDAVNQQLDSVENEFANASHPDGTGNGFSDAQPDVEKEFSSNSPYVAKESPHVRPEQQNTGVMLKSFLDPDLSPTPRPKLPSNVKTRVHTVDIGAEIFHYRYQEPRYQTIDGNTTADVKNRGPMYGYYANYAYRPADPNFFNNFISNVYMLQARYDSSHDLEYTGSGEVKHKHDAVDEFRGLIGKDYFVGTDSRVTPYFGFGYRYLIDHGNGEADLIGNTLYTGYDRKSHYYYLPLGGDWVVEMPKDWEIDFNAEYDIFLQGYEKSYTSDGNQFTGMDDGDLVNHQDTGYGIRASVKFLRRGSLMDFYVEPFIRIWEVDQSKAETIMVDGAMQTLVEPKNNTTEIGSRFGVQF